MTALDSRSFRTSLSKDMDSPCRRSIRQESSAEQAKSVAACLSNVRRIEWNYSEKVFENNILRTKFDHDCVLFVQHPSENSLTHPVLSGSFVACAELFGNCHVATEGGIPRSSR
jgi:hypothetical protein